MNRPAGFADRPHERNSVVVSLSTLYSPKFDDTSNREPSAVIRTRIAYTTVMAAGCGMVFGVGCAGVHQRPWLFPNRARKAAAPASAGIPRVELRPPSGDLPAESPMTVPPLNAPMD